MPRHQPRIPVALLLAAALWVGAAAGLSGCKSNGAGTTSGTGGAAGSAGMGQAGNGAGGELNGGGGTGTGGTAGQGIGGSPQPTGGAGGGGTAGQGIGGAGGGGTAGQGVGGGPQPTGGAGGGNLAACPFPGAGVEVSVIGSDDQWFIGSLAAHVTVGAVQSCASTSCPLPSIVQGGLPGRASTDALRILLVDQDSTTANNRWTLYLLIPGMPADYFQVGDQFDLNVGSAGNSIFYTTLDQTMTLSQGGHLMVFAGTRQQFGAALLPTVASAELMVEDAGESCKGAFDPSCGTAIHGARVSTPEASSLILPGQTIQVGTFSFSVDQFTQYIDTGFCDSKSNTRMAAFKHTTCSGTAAMCTSGPATCCGDSAYEAHCRDNGTWGCSGTDVLASTCTGYDFPSRGACQSR